MFFSITTVLLVGSKLTYHSKVEINHLLHDNLESNYLWNTFDYDILELLRKKLKIVDKGLNKYFKPVYIYGVSELNEFEPRLKSAENRFQLSIGLNLETLNTILSETNHIWAAAWI